MNPDLPNNIDLDNPEFKNAWDLITTTHRSVFLTGKAGTGKSTFLKYICQNTSKKYIVLAPTGIAAVNVGGMTLHSFFKIPLKPLLPDDVDFSTARIRKTLRYTSEKVKILKELDLIIIDEISMVRADILDFIDKVLRVYTHNMREPFGGKQLLLVGDIFQLEPVVTPDMRELLKRAYNQCFFFNAYAFKNVDIIPIELKKIYRQTNAEFISMLDRIRIDGATSQDLALLNRRLDPDYKEADGDFIITLATRRDVVDVINEEHLKELPSQEYTYQGEIDGVFPSQNLPTALELVVKVDAQVIFIKNDRNCRWINGTLGRIVKLEDDNICVELEDGSQHVIEPEIWENVQYSYDDKAKRVKENVIGSFKQYPIKPAWALTVHKSQGLTFNKIIIDFAGGAFSSGQTYVALSRCTSLEGIYLRQPIRDRDIFISPSVLEFSKRFNNKLLINTALNHSQAETLYKETLWAYEHNEFQIAVDTFAKAIDCHNILSHPLIKRFIASKLGGARKLRMEIDELNKKIEIQNRTLMALAEEYVDLSRQSLEFVEVNEDEMAYGAGNKVQESIESLNVKSALANLNKALKIWPECVEAMIEKGKIYARFDEMESAEAFYKKVLDIDPKNYEANFLLGIIRYEEKDYGSALKMMKRALRTNKNSIECNSKIAEIYDEIGLDDLAEKHRDLVNALKKNKNKKREV